MTADAPAVELRVVDLDRHAAMCVEHFEDVFRLSFHDDERFLRKFGEGAAEYVAWLRDAVRDFPEGHVHAWLGDEAVGQVSMRPLQDDPSCGYVNLIYVTPPWRGKGVAAQLEAYVVDWLRAQGCRTARLAVSATNTRAIRFYRRRGWSDAGSRPGRPDERVMERALYSASKTSATGGENDSPRKS